MPEEGFSGTDLRNYKFPQTLSSGQTFTYYSGIYSDNNAIYTDGNYTVTVTSALIQSEKIYRLKNVNSGKYLNVSRGLGDVNGMNVFQRTSNTSELAQEFRIVYDSSTSAYRFYPICNMNGRHHLLDIKRGSNPVANGNNVQICSSVDNPAQLFRIEDIGSGKCKITANSNTAVAIASYGTGDGTEGGIGPTGGNVFMQTYTGANNQLWYIEEYTDRHEDYYAGLGFVYPLSASKITDGYGYRIHPVTGAYSFHNGTDFPAAAGSLLYAPFAGKVIRIYYDPITRGNYIIIEATSKNVYSSSTKIRVIYMHMIESPTTTNPAVVEGATVSTSTLIGKVGSTGNSTAAHLHMTVITDGSQSGGTVTTSNGPQMYYNTKTFTYH